MEVVKNQESSKCRGVAQPGSAPALGAGGRAFKSPRPDHRINRLQADKSRTCVSGSSISLFESIESALCVKRCVRTVSELSGNDANCRYSDQGAPFSISGPCVIAAVGNGDVQDD